MSQTDPAQEATPRPERQGGDSLPAVIPGGWALDTYVPEQASRRSDRLAAQRRRRRTTVFAVSAAALLVLVVGAVAVPLLARESTPVAAPEPTPAAAAAAVAETVDPEVLLLVTHDDEPDAPARSITLLATAEDGRGAVVFVPTGLLLDVPGIGLDRVAVAQRYQDVSLVADSLSEALDLEIDDSIALDTGGLSNLLGATGDLTVDVGDAALVSRPTEGAEPVTFEPGEQDLDGERLARYWMLAAEDEPALSELPRQQQVLSLLLRRLADDPDVLKLALLGDAIDEESTVGPQELRETLTRLAEARGESRLAFGVLPVEEFGGTGLAGATTFRLGEEAQTIVTSLLGQAGEDVDTVVEVRAAVDDFAERAALANQVQEALGADFQVSLAQPSDDEQPDETQILLHADSLLGRQRAEAVQQRLGVGTITLDEQPQSVADVTVVLGQDFPAGDQTGNEDTEQGT